MDGKLKRVYNHDCQSRSERHWPNDQVTLPNVFGFDRLRHRVEDRQRQREPSSVLHGDWYADTDANTDTDTDTDTDANPNHNAAANTDTDADANTDANAD